MCFPGAAPPRFSLLVYVSARLTSVFVGLSSLLCGIHLTSLYVFLHLIPFCFVFFYYENSVWPSQTANPFNLSSQSTQPANPIVSIHTAPIHDLTTTLLIRYFRSIITPSLYLSNQTTLNNKFTNSLLFYLKLRAVRTVGTFICKSPLTIFHPDSRSPNIQHMTGDHLQGICL